MQRWLCGIVLHFLNYLRTCRIRLSCIRSELSFGMKLPSSKVWIVKWIVLLTVICTWTVWFGLGNNLVASKKIPQTSYFSNSIIRKKFSGKLPSKAVVECRNETNFKVPNIIHHIWFGKRVFQFYHYISLRSAALIQKPQSVRVYYDIEEPQGPLWRLYKSEVPCLTLIKYEAPKTIFGKQINVVEHKADVARLRIIISHGGIYLDTDTVVVKPFDPLMKYSCVLGQALPNTFGNGIILAEPYADFVMQWYATYNTFDDAKWGEHSVIMPYKLHKNHPELPFHPEITSFLKPNWVTGMEWFEKKNYDISKNYCVHLYARYMHKETLNYEESDILELNVTYGALARIALYGKPDLIHVTNITSDILQS